MGMSMGSVTGTKGLAGVPSVLGGRKHAVVGAKQVKPQPRKRNNGNYDSRAGVITKTKAQSDEEVPAKSPESDQ